MRDFILKLFPVENKARHEIVDKYTRDMLLIQREAKKKTVQSKQTLDATLILAKSMGVI